MGYRSDVTYVFYTSNTDAVPFSVIKLWFDENFPKHDFGEVEVGEDSIAVWYTDVKWYRGYHEVEAVERAIEIFTVAFEANDKDNVAWEMVRIGEELADIEHDGSTHHNYRLGVNRSIHFE